MADPIRFYQIVFVLVGVALRLSTAVVLNVLSRTELYLSGMKCHCKQKSDDIHIFVCFRHHVVQDFAPLMVQ